MKSAHLIFLIGLFGCGSTQDKVDASDATMPDSPVGDANADDGSDGSPVDAGSDALDAGDAADVVPATYNDITNGINWQSFADPSKTLAFATATFDGRYVYYAPLSGTNNTLHGTTYRYDTTGSFQSALSWSSFDFTQINSNAKGYYGTVFDGRYIYYAPFVCGMSCTNTLVMRFDTKATFTNGGSWSIFDVAGLDAKAGGYIGAAFDGRYIYFVPQYSSPMYASVTIRYDTKASFTSGASWQKFDMAVKSANANSFSGAVFDGRYIYYVPLGAFNDGSVIARFDTMGTFTDQNAWTVYDIAANVNPASKAFRGGTFDGRYVYFTPYGTNATGGVITRYDTKGAFTTKGSWQTYDMTNWKMAAGGFNGSIFDGRYLTLIPMASTLAVSYDTQASLTSATSYTGFDVAAYIKIASEYAGGAFDGEFVYFAPLFPGRPMLRFDAKTPPSIPATYNGSFY